MNRKQWTQLIGVATLAVLFSGGLALGLAASWNDTVFVQDDVILGWGGVDDNATPDIQSLYDEAGDDRLEFSDGTNLLMYLTDAGTTGNAGVTGTFDATSGYTVNGGALAPHDLDQDGATTDQVIAWNGSIWTPTDAESVSLPQPLDVTDSPTFAGVTLSGLTASSLVATDGSKAMTSSVAGLSPTFAGLQITGQNNVIGNGSSAWGSATLEIAESSPVLLFNRTTAADQDSRLWYFQVTSDTTMVLAVTNDAKNSFASPLRITRSGTTIDEIELNATLFDFNGAGDISGDWSVLGGDLTVGAAAAGNIGTTTNPNQLQFVDATNTAIEGSVDVQTNVLIGGKLEDDSVSANHIELDDGVTDGVDIESGAALDIDAVGNIGIDAGGTMTVAAASNMAIQGDASVTIDIDQDNNSTNAGFLIEKDASTFVASFTEDNALTQAELSADPANPGEGTWTMWMSDGTGFGDDGDLCMKVTAGGVTKTFIWADFSTF